MSVSLPYRADDVRDQLRGALRRLDAAERVAGIGSWEHDVETGVTVWSAGARRLLRLAPDAPLDAECVRAHVEPCDRVVFDLALQAPGPVDVAIRRADGAGAVLSLRAEADLAADGSVLRRRGTLTDVTAARAAEARARAGERRAHDLLRADAVVLVDADGRIVQANDRVADVFGHEPAELAGRQLTALVPPAARGGAHRRARRPALRRPRRLQGRQRQARPRGG